MAFDAEIKTLTLDQNNLVKKIGVSGAVQISIQGNFSGPATITHTVETSEGVGAEVRTPATAADAYESHTVESRFTLTGADGSTDITIVITKIVTSSRDV